MKNNRESSPNNIEKKRLSEEEQHLLGTAIYAITGESIESETSEEEVEEQVEKLILNGVRGLPDQLAEIAGDIDLFAYKQGERTLLLEIEKEQSDPYRLAELQLELIHHYIALISRVQESGEIGFTPSLAREVGEMDCSLGVWSLKEKLESSNVPSLVFEFGYPAGHAAGVVTTADGRRFYVDAQNGFVEEVELEEVFDSDNPDTAYPIFEVRASKRLVAHSPGEGEALRMRKGGSDYMPRYLGVQNSGVLSTLGNMHLFVNPSSDAFDTETGKYFRQGIGISEPETQEDLLKIANEWRAYYSSFEALIDEFAGGKVIAETKFGDD